MKYVIIGHPIQINVSQYSAICLRSLAASPCSALIYGIQLPGKWDWKMLLHYSRNE